MSGLRPLLLQLSPITLNLMGKAKKIFILDDDDCFRAETGKLLTENGYEVATCGMPTQSFSPIRIFQPDCLLLDVRMPLFDGRQILPWLRRQWPGLPIVIITGMSDLSLNEFMRQGVFCLLEKPFTCEMLFKAIEHAIRLAPGSPEKAA